MGKTEIGQRKNYSNPKMKHRFPLMVIFIMLNSNRAVSKSLDKIMRQARVFNPYSPEGFNWDDDALLQRPNEPVQVEAPVADWNDDTNAPIKFQFVRRQFNPFSPDGFSWDDAILQRPSEE